MSGSPVLAYRISVEVVLVVVVLGSAYSIYRRRRQRRLETIPLFEAEKTEGARPWSRQSLINRMSLESGPKVEGEDGRYSFDYEPPMRVGDNPLPTIPPLIFNDARLIRQPEDSLRLLPPQPSLADLPAQPAAALLSKSLTRRASDAITSKARCSRRPWRVARDVRWTAGFGLRVGIRTKAMLGCLEATKDQ